MRKSQIYKAVIKAMKLANKKSEGTVIIQILPTNRSLLVTHQIGDDWDSLGTSATDSKNRILESFACGERYDLYNGDNVEDIVDRMVNTIEDNFADVKT